MQTSDTLPLLKITPLSDCICVHGTYMKGGNEVVDTRDSRKTPVECPVTINQSYSNRCLLQQRSRQSMKIKTVYHVKSGSRQQELDLKQGKFTVAFINASKIHISQ
ncbi:hypothetical protein PV325_002666 [Microctonus aethiopoides]|nr:hypothetical protein PV325_002666 [Microctonus aethiopoides]